jgi:signal transduction histidine kinase
VIRRLPQRARGLPQRARRLSLRARLLAGLIAVIAVFLIVMGTVSTTVLSRLEQNQFLADLRLTARETPAQISAAGDGYVAAYLNVRTGEVGALSATSPAEKELEDELTTMAGAPRARVRAFLLATARRDEPFSLTDPDATTTPGPALRAVWRPLAASAATSGLVPPGENILLVARPESAVSSEVHGLVAAELITGGVLLALLAICGNWLIARGLAPLGRMARTADLITAWGDLTERMPVPAESDRHETGKLAAAINTMLDRIQQSFADRLRSEAKVRQFAADASHEMRTPLTTIRGYAELYRQGALGPDELPSAMRRIEQEAERMSRLVAELLELARLDRTSSLDLTETDLAELARDAVADARAVEPDRPISAEVPGEPVIVTADEPRLRQVLANLLANVAAHTPPGTPATVTLSKQGDGALIEVADTGPGMSPDDATRAFDRFYRVPGTAVNAASNNNMGSGLGLSIVQAIAAAHGGHARLTSAPGTGTAVRVWIPMKTEPSPPAPRLPQSSGEVHRGERPMSAAAATDKRQTRLSSMAWTSVLAGGARQFSSLYVIA